VDQHILIKKFSDIVGEVIENGYCVSTIPGATLGLLEMAIVRQVNEVYSEYGKVNNFPPKKFENIIQLEDYHLCALSELHSTCWYKSARTLPQNIVEGIVYPWVNSIVESRRFQVSDEDSQGYGVVHFRICRPDFNDVGPLHADSMFWDLGFGSTPADHTRIHVWIPVITEVGLNGLQVLPRSHKRHHNFRIIQTDRGERPSLLIDDEYDAPALLPLRAGEVVFFHDNLVHGGRIGGKKTRVSIEFTIEVYDGNSPTEVKL